jgi:hypothetical protein
MPYTIKGDDRPEDIAYYYYGDPQHVWLVNLSNKIINPYYDWPISSYDFDNMVINKYAEQSGFTGTNVLTWALNTTITDNIVHAVNVQDPNVKISTYTYLNLIDSSQWTPIRVYDFENDLNESKRIIYLVNKVYLSQAESELKKVLNA